MCLMYKNTLQCKKPKNGRKDKKYRKKLNKNIIFNFKVLFLNVLFYVLKF